MALSKLEKAMGTYILGFTPPGRKALEIAFIAAVKGGQMAGRAALPLAARALPPVARAAVNPYVGVPLAAAAGTYALQEYAEESGLQAQQVAVTEQATEQALAFLTGAIPKGRRIQKSAYNKAVSVAMKAVKASSYQGRKGTISNAKKTFGTVAKTVSKAKKGRKLSAKGVTGVIKRSISGMFKPKAKRRTSSTPGKAQYTFRTN